MTSPRIAVVGAGLIGQRHAEHVSRQATLATLIDPLPAAKKTARDHGAPWHADFAAYLASDKPDGVILATPNHLHVEQGLQAVAAGVPTLIEKPIADESRGAAQLVEAAELAGVPLLVGHHRRHGARMARAKQMIDDGLLGDIIAVNAQFWLYKPNDYFEAEWRTKTGAGPVFINLIHDLDLMRHFCGEVVRVQAMESNRARGFEVEDTAALLMQFASGALGTISVSDTVVAPWSWEMTSAENPVYPHVETHAYTIGGTQGGLSIPDLRLWTHPNERSWWAQIESELIDAPDCDPIERQITHFIDVIAGAAPLVSGREGLRTLRLLEAIKRAAATGETQAVDST
ncbi:MAG: Gfo/Idh/MocA family oxidoreductase [Pseudomonadota bacterium]